MTDYIYIAVPAAAAIAALGLAGYSVKKKTAKSGKNKTTPLDGK